MKKILLLLIIISSISAAVFSESDSWIDKNKSMISFYKRNQINKAFDFAYPFYEKLSKEYQEKKLLPADAVLFLVNFGVICRKASKFDQALEILKLAEKCKLKISSSKDPLFVVIYKNMASVLEYNNKNKEAEKYYLKAIEVKSVNIGERHSDMVPLFIHLGNFYQSVKSKKAMSAYEKALQIAKETSGPESLITADVYMAMGKYYLSLEKKDEAVSHLSFALDLYNKYKEIKKLSLVCDSFGFLYQKFGEYQEAESYFRLALKHKDKVFGRNSIQYVKTLNNLGAVYHIQNNPKAEKTLMEALTISETKFGKSNPSLKHIVNNLIDYYNKKGDAEMVKKYQDYL